MNESIATLTPDTFLNVLGLREVEQQLRGVDQREALFKLTVAFLKERALPAEVLPNNASLAEFPLRVPGTAVVVRLSGSVQQEVAALLGVAGYLLGSGMLDAKSVTLVGVMALLTRLRKLRTDFGERSIVDVLGEVDRKTARNVASLLYGKPCRYPRSNCRYRAPNGEHCIIGLNQVEATLNDLVERNILRRLTAAEPTEFTVVF